MIEYPRTEWGASQAVIALRLRVRRQDADPWEYIPIPDSDNADGGSFSYCDCTPPHIVREFFVYMALLTASCKDFVFMVDYSPAGKTKFKRSFL